MWMPYATQEMRFSASDFRHYISNSTLPEEVWMKADPRPRKERSTPTMVYLGYDPAKTRGYNGVKTWFQVHEDWPASKINLRATMVYVFLYCIAAMENLTVMINLMKLTVN